MGDAAQLSVMGCPGLSCLRGRHCGILRHCGFILEYNDVPRKSKSSNRWLQRQKRDYFVRRAQSDGVVSRAHFKLQQIDQKYQLIRRTSRILELGAAPGGWTGYVESRLAPGGGLIAVDPLPITAGAETHVVCGKAGEAEVNQKIDELVKELWGSRGLDLVLSDMAPNISGVRAVDQARSMELADVTLEASRQWLKAGGAMVVKAFQGAGLDSWVSELRAVFEKVAITKPKASRPESREVFVVARLYVPDVRT